MLIKKVQLNNFSRFELANVKKFKAIYTSPIQIIIGSNGAGKSSMLNELTPYPTPKPVFGNTGYKELDVEHNGDLYKLISDYTNKAKTYSFIKNDEDLNLSGTSSIQTELVKEHLGYTQVVDDILRFRYQITSMSKSERKVFFLTINPIDLSLILDKHKYICSKIRETKNNLSLLNKRKQELLAKKLDKSIVDEYLSDKSILDKELEEITKDIISISTIRSTIINDYNQLDKNIIDVDIKDIKNIKKKIFKLLGSYVVPSNVQSTIHELSTNIDINNSKIESLSNTILDLLTEVETYNTHLESASSVGDTNILEQELTRKKDKIKFIESTLPDDLIVIPKEEYYSFTGDIYGKIIDLIRSIQYSNIAINKKEDNTLLKYKCNQYEKEITDLNISINNNETKIVQLDIELSKILKSDIATFDECNKCDYKLSYTSIEDKLLKEKEFYTNSNKELIEKRDKLHEIFTIEKENLDNQRNVYRFIIELFNMIENTCFKMTQDELIDEFILDKNKLMVRIRTSTEYTLKAHELSELKTEVVSLETQLSTLKETKVPSIDFLKSILDTKKNTVADLYNQIEDISNIVTKCEDEKKLHHLYIFYLDILKDYSNKLSLVYSSTYLSKSILFCDDTLKELQSKKEEIINKLGLITNVLKEQESIDLRIKEEIESLIYEVEYNRTKYELIEFGISPNSGFPHKHLVNHINTLINNANIIINHVWSYPLILQKIDESKELDYTIGISINDTIIKDDISKLSKGQQVIVNLAFMIACMLSMNITNYPIFLDECDDGLDPHHKQKLLELQKYLVDNNYVSQMFMVNHEAVLFDGFSDSEICALKLDNIVKPPRLNEHVELK